MINGHAGAGKSCLALLFLLNTIQNHPAHQGKILYVAHSDRLVRHMQGLWETHPLAEAYHTEQTIQFLTYETLMKRVCNEYEAWADDTTFDAWYQTRKATWKRRFPHPAELYSEFQQCAGQPNKEH